MRFTINRLELLKCISTINCGVETSSTSPIQGLAKIKVDDGVVKFTAINMDMGISRSCNAKSDINGEVLVDIKRISEWVSRCREEEVTLKKNATTLSLKCGKSSFNLKLKDINIPEFPELTPGEIVNSEDLVSLIDDVIQASGDDPGKAYTNGVHLNIESNKISTTATQGNLLIYSEKTSENKTEISVVLPKKIANDVKRLLKDTSKVSISKTTNTTIIYFEESTVMFFRNTDAKLPKWRSMIPSNDTPEIVVNSEDLRDVLNRVAVSLDADTRVNIVVSNNSIKVTSFGNIGDNDEECDCVYSGDIVFNINWRFMHEALKGVQGQASLIYNSQNKPLIIYRKDSRDYIAALALIN